MAKLTKKRLMAIRDALQVRLHDEAFKRRTLSSEIQDYEAALEWAQGKIVDKERKPS